MMDTTTPNTDTLEVIKEKLGKLHIFVNIFSVQEKSTPLIILRNPICFHISSLQNFSSFMSIM